MNNQIHRILKAVRADSHPLASVTT